MSQDFSGLFLEIADRVCVSDLLLDAHDGPVQRVEPGGVCRGDALGVDRTEGLVNRLGATRTVGPVVAWGEGKKFATNMTR